ncbi:MAG: BglG family transcription antiterminator [Breznakia sp.]
MNKRILEISHFLLQSDDYVTVDIIAKKLLVSNKTIRNDLRIVETWLCENELSLVKKTGVGIKIDGEKNNKLKVWNTIKQKNKQLIDYSPEARKIYIAMRLLTCENVLRIYELASELYVSRATIHKDIIEVSKMFKKEKISLARKNNNGIHISGKERNIRNVLYEMMLHDNGYNTFVSIINNENYACDGSIVFAGLDINDDEIKEFIDLMRSLSNPFFHTLNFDALVLALLHIYISYLRISKQQFVSLSTVFLEELKQQAFYFETQTIMQALCHFYTFPYFEMEVRYLQVYFISLQTNTQPSNQDKDEAKEVAFKLIKSWSQQLQMPLHKDNELFLSLYAHLCPAITRFRHNIQIKNSLISDIQKTYKNTFGIVQKSSTYINEQYNIQLKTDEIGFLALHLAAALDRFKKPLKAILVCHSGIGASNLLTQKIMKHIPEIKIVEQESFISIYENSLKDIDLIITTVDLHLQSSLLVLHISSILEQHDLNRLKDIVSEYYKLKNNPQSQTNKM